eukprot:841316_1
MSNEKEFFRSKAEIDAWSRDLDAFGPFLESYKESLRDERVQFGVWMSTLVDGNSDISWHPIRKGIQYMPSPRLSGSPTTKLALSDMPSHDGPVSLTASDPKSGDLFEWKLLLATDAITGKASVVKASLDTANSAHFDSIFNAIRSGTPIFAWSKWGGTSVYFPIGVDTGEFRDLYFTGSMKYENSVLRRNAARTGALSSESATG